MEEIKVMGKVTPEMNDRIYRLATDLTKNLEPTEKVRKVITVRDVLHTLYLFENEERIVIQRWAKLIERSGWSEDLFRKSIECLTEMGLFTPTTPCPSGYLIGVLTWTLPEDE